MNKKLIIFIGLLILAAVVIYAWNQKPGSKNTFRDKPVFKNLTKKVNDIKSLIISNGNKSLTIDSKNNIWVLKEKNNFPVDIVAIRKLILTLADAKYLDPKTTKKELYSNLGLEENNRTNIIAYKDDRVDKVFSLSIGKTTSVGTYVLVNDNKQVWLVSGNLSVSTKTNDWLNTTLLKIKENDILSIEIKHNNKEPILLENNNKAIQLVGIKENEKPNLANINNLTGILKDISFSDISDTKDLANPVKTTVSLKNGLVLNVEVFSNKEKEQEKFFAKFLTSLNQNNIKQDKDNTEDSILDITQKTSELIKELSATFNNRVFGISHDMAKALSYTREELIESK